MATGDEGPLDASEQRLAGHEQRPLRHEREAARQAQPPTAHAQQRPEQEHAPAEHAQQPPEHEQQPPRFDRQPARHEQQSAEDGRQLEVIERARTFLPRDERVLGVYLVGSYATGQADRFSDVDVHLVIADESVQWFEENWAEVLRALAGPTVLTDRVPGLLGGLGITTDWLHVDLFAHPLSSFDRFQYDGVRVLFDRDGTLFPEGDIPAKGGRPGDPYWPVTNVNLFFYFLGNLVTVLGRDERIVGHQGVGVVRDQLIALMLAERGVHRTSGAKRLNALLSDEQRAALEAIPAAGTHPADIIAANQYICRQFIARGTALAERTGNRWPKEFVDTTLAHLQNHFGVSFD